MKKLTVLFGLIFSLGSFSQSSKSIEAVDADTRKEAQEEQQVRQEWDRKEAEARRIEEEKRIRDEEEAETDQVQSKPALDGISQ